MAAREMSSNWIPEFHNQLRRGRHLVLTGNIADQFLVNGQYQSLLGFLDRYFQEEGYEVVGRYDIVDGLRFATPEMQAGFGGLLLLLLRERAVQGPLPTPRRSRLASSLLDLCPRCRPHVPPGLSDLGNLAWTA